MPLFPRANRRPRAAPHAQKAKIFRRRLPSAVGTYQPATRQAMRRVGRAVLNRLQQPSPCAATAIASAAPRRLHARRLKLVCGARPRTARQNDAKSLPEYTSQQAD